MYNIDLGLEEYTPSLKLKKNTDNNTLVFDPIRKKWIVLEPEEFVRQLLIQKLLTIPGFKAVRISVERVFKKLPQRKRFDLLILNKNLQPFLLVECKAPGVDITEKTFLQAGWYNDTLKVPYVLVTNGHQTFCLSINHETMQYSFLKEIPSPSAK
jgi:hypothetical protein